MHLEPIKTTEELKSTPTFGSFFSDPSKFHSFLNQKTEVANKGEFATFLSTGKEAKAESDEEDDEESKDNLAVPSEVPEIEIKTVPLATSPYSKILSVLVCCDE